MAASATGAEAHAPHPLGGVELREDVPLKRSAGAGAARAARCCGGGPRIISAAFAALTACITLALLTQIYCGDYELVPHGSVSSSAAACSRAGTDALKAGGRALDAAAAAALCLAVVAPHRTSLDASGSMLYWEYRESRTQQPTLYEWGGPAGGGAGGERAPRLVAALAHLHAQLGALPWPRLLAPAIQLASEGFLVSDGLAAESARRGDVRRAAAGANDTAPELARYLRSLLLNTSAELSAAWGSAALVRASSPARERAGSWRALAGGAGAGAVLRALQAALQPPPADADEAQQRVVSALQSEPPAGGPDDVATGLAVVDSRDTYVALVTGLSEPFGSGEVSAAGWRRDEPTAPLDLAPALLLDPNVCGSRYVLGAESSAALAQAGAALAAGATPAAERAAAAVERARAARGADGALLPERANSTRPRAAVNLVLQRGDALSSHADSRGGGLASRF